MKKIILLLFLFVSAAGVSLAQEEGGGREGGGKLKAYQIAFLTKKLNLSPEEAQRFWPVFNKYEDEIRISRIQNKQATEVERQEKELNINKKYFDEFARVLNKDRADRVFKADREFRDVVRKELMERRQLRQQNNRPFKQ
ncbi:MAG: hypothetical protein WCF67_03830 [Chitinophagaceae bacterium]